MANKEEQNKDQNPLAAVVNKGSNTDRATHSETAVAAESIQKIEGKTPKDSVTEAVGSTGATQKQSKPRQALSKTWQVWEKQLQNYGGAQTLLHFEDNPEKTINLTNADSSGFTQLMSGRKTRLSHVLRDKSLFTQSLNTAKLLSHKIYELANERGIDSAFMACGFITAKGRDGVTVNAPLLLSRLQLEQREGEEDFEIQISRAVGINPALVRWFWVNYRVNLTSLGLEEAAFGGFRLEVLPALDRVKAAASSQTDITTTLDYVIGSFADLEVIHPQDIINPRNNLLAALAGEKDALREYEDKDEFTPSVAIDDRDPEKEFLLLDADADQQAVIDVVAAGKNATVRTPPGTGATQTIVNSLGTLVSEGKRVLVLGERRAEIAEIINKLQELNLENLVLDVTQAADIKQQLINALFQNERAREKDVKDLYSKLRNQRKALKKHVELLHRDLNPWNSSPLSAMKTLTELKQLDNPPSTQVYLERDVLEKSLDRKETNRKFDELASLGYFQDLTHHSAWYRADIHDREQVQEARTLAKELSTRDFPELVQQMTAIAKYSSIRLARTPRGWGQQLEVLLAVEESLGTFKKEIFNIELAEMIAATAPSSWRREENIQIGVISRNKLKNQAKGLILDDVAIPVDLHEALINVQEQAQHWHKFAATEDAPRVHQNTEMIYQTYQKVMDKLKRLSKYLVTTYDGDTLYRMRYQDLQKRLNALANDQDVLNNLPSTNKIEYDLINSGYGDLLEDCIMRRVPASQLSNEIELAWWQSVLQEMIDSSKDGVNLADGPTLRKLQAEFRINDKAHIASCAERLAYNMKLNWNQSVRAYPDQASQIKELLRSYMAPLLHVWQLAPDLLNSLTPIWVASPANINDIPRDVHFDVAIVLDAAKTNIVSTLPAIARTNQVIAFGDDSIAAPKPFSVEVEQNELNFSSDDDSRSALEALDSVSTQLKLRTMYRTVDEKLVDFMREQNYYNDVLRLPLASSLLNTESALAVHYVSQGFGRQGTQKDSIESIQDERDYVIKLVKEHVRLNPEESLAVITASQVHAARLNEDFAAELESDRELNSFIKQHLETTPFTVLTLEQAYGVTRDNIIFSLGYGFNPHGRVVYDFGPLSTDNGYELFVQSLTWAKKKLNFVSCFKAENLKPEKLDTGAKGIYALVKFAEDNGLTANYGEKSVVKPEEVNISALNNPLTVELANRLKNFNLNVAENYGNEIDLAVYSDLLTSGKKVTDLRDQRVRPLAVESDGTERYRNMSVRERNRLRPELFETYGWRYMPLWSLEAFTDADLYAVSIEDYLQGSVKVKEPKNDAVEEEHSETEAE
ncbi:MAG: hypothetical protein QM613_01085 [Micrococcaceae bacterium]